MQKTKLEAVQALQEADALEKQSREDKEAVLSFLRKELGALKPVRCQSSSPHSGFSENSVRPMSKRRSRRALSSKSNPFLASAERTLPLRPPRGPRSASRRCSS